MSEIRNEPNRLDEINERVVGDLTKPGKYPAGGLPLRNKVTPKGFGVRVMPNGKRSFYMRYRHPKSGIQYLETLGMWSGDGGKLDTFDAVKDALDLIQKIGAEGKDEKAAAKEAEAAAVAEAAVVAAKSKTINDLLDLFVAEGMDGLRTRDEVILSLKRHVRPAIGHVGLYDIRKSHVVEMVRSIKKSSGSTMAARAFAHFRRACAWYDVEQADDDFVSPVRKGMTKGMGTTRRERILFDQELRDLWAALDKVTEPACYARYIRFLLLTATRRSEASDMHISELQGDNWTIPGSRYKRLPKHHGLAHLIPLSAAAKAMIVDKPKGCTANHWFAFSTTAGRVPFSGFSKAKVLLDNEIDKIRRERGDNPIADWRLHDLRRTARTLMSRAKVDADTAERCLGHIIGGVRGVYDQHGFEDEKRHAFEALAAMVDRIVNPQPNVIPLRAAEPA